MGVDKLLNIPLINLSEKYFLRPLYYRDYTDIFEFHKSNKNITRYLHYGHYKTSSDCLYHVVSDYLVKPLKNQPIPHVLVDRMTNKVIGVIGFSAFRSATMEGELFYVLDPKYWGRGIMTKVVREIVKYAFDYVGVIKLYAQHVEEDIANKKVITRNKFSFLSSKKNDRFMTDQFYYYITKSMYFGEGE